MKARKLSANLIEATNRAEVTALLIRHGYKVYRPEADDGGEDLVVRLEGGSLVPVQLKGRLHVDRRRYGERNVWMLFPCSPWDSTTLRSWFLIPHDTLFAYLEERHGHAKGFEDGVWSTRSPSQHARKFLAEYQIG